MSVQARHQHAADDAARSEAYPMSSLVPASTRIASYKEFSQLYESTYTMRVTKTIHATRLRRQ
jgi:hypothetical protein